MNRIRPSKRLIHQLFTWMQELKWAECVWTLRAIFFEDRNAWCELQTELLNLSGGQTEAIVTILNASCAEDISMYYPLVPGLSSMQTKKTADKIEALQEPERFPSEDAIRERFWDNFCKENPEEFECKIYEA